MFSLAGKIVVVAGGTSGMGLGAVRATLAAGAERVIAAGRRPAGARDADLPAGRAQQIIFDMTDEASVRSLFDGIGALHHLLITASPPAARGPFLNQDLEDARAFMRGKFFGSWLCARHAAPLLRPGGSITFLTGAASIRPATGASMVTATFAALEAFSQALAVELGPIRVNTIRPGVIDSDMWNFLGADGRERLRRRVRETFPARRIGSVDDIGRAAVFLMTNPYVTGTVLEVTGGEQFAEPLRF